MELTITGFITGFIKQLPPWCQLKKTHQLSHVTNDLFPRKPSFQGCVTCHFIPSGPAMSDEGSSLDLHHWFLLDKLRHCLNKCWLSINEIPWISPENNFIASVRTYVFIQDLNIYLCDEYKTILSLYPSSAVSPQQSVNVTSRQSYAPLVS